VHLGWKGFSGKMRASMKPAYLVYNPAAGLFDKRELVIGAAARLESHGWQIQVEETGSGGDATRLAQDAARKGHAAFFIAGGDGSIGQAAAGLAGSQTALGALPGGTANVWARELGLRGLTSWNRRALEDGAEQLARGRVQAVDVGVCNGPGCDHRGANGNPPPGPPPFRPRQISQFVVLERPPVGRHGFDH
jgi:diacylglycerol kinase family enzyme